MDIIRRFISIFIVVLITMLWMQSISFASSSTPLSIYTVNYPLAYFAERIGGDHVEVVFPAPADVDPAYWMPDKETISRYQRADLILLNGAHYAKWIEKVALPRAKMVNTSRKFKEKYIRMAAEVTHSHGAAGEHAHEDAAFTLWLDFELAVMQAEGWPYVKRDKQIEIKKMVTERLLPDMPPALTGIPMVYDAVEKLIYAGAMSEKQIDALTINFEAAVSSRIIPMTFPINFYDN